MGYGPVAIRVPPRQRLEHLGIGFRDSPRFRISIAVARLRRKPMRIPILEIFTQFAGLSS
jgi:hypothetical protein